MRTFRKPGLGKLIAWGAILVLAAGGVVCGSKKPSSASGSSSGGRADLSGVVLQVGDATYRTADFLRYVDTSAGVSWKKLGAVTLSRFFDQFVDDRLLFQAAMDDRVSLTPEERQQGIQKVKEEGWTPEEEKAALASDSGPLAERLKVEKYVSAIVQDLTVSDDEISAYYDAHKGQFFLPERMKVSQILLPSEARAVEVWEKLRGASEEDFRAMARTESRGPEAAEGGQMGVFQKGQLPPEMEAAILSLQPGETSPIVESSYGFHIFRLDEKFPAEQTSLKEAATSIKTNLLDQKVKAVVARRLLDLRESLDWTAYPERLPFAYQKVER